MRGGEDQETRPAGRSWHVRALLGEGVNEGIQLARLKSRPAATARSKEPLCACGSSAGGANSYRIASAPVKGDAIYMAALFGVLEGRANSDGTACLWVGHGSEASALSWPYGYTAGGSPLTVYDDTGTGVAVVDQRVTFAGGLLPDDVHSILGCQGLTKFWGVGCVEEARWDWLRYALASLGEARPKHVLCNELDHVLVTIKWPPSASGSFDLTWVCSRWA